MQIGSIESNNNTKVNTILYQERISFQHLHHQDGDRDRDKDRNFSRTRFPSTNRNSDSVIKDNDVFSQTIRNTCRTRKNTDLIDKEDKRKFIKRRAIYLKANIHFKPIQTALDHINNDLQTSTRILMPINITVNILNNHYVNFNKVKTSNCSQGHIRAYSVNSYQGIARNYNEDRVSIFVNMTKPHDFKGEWPEHCSYFGVFDGHSGSACSDFLRDNFHNFLIENEHFGDRTDKAIYDSFDKADKLFMSKYALNEDSSLKNRSGSCALIALILNDKCYIANVGDSRAIVSRLKGSKITQITTDHKPKNIKERQRIIKNGGTIYQSTRNEIYRANPGKLSVSRTIGDASAKVPSLGGNPGVIVSTPDIYSFQLSHSTDFLVLCTDGICDTLLNDEIMSCPWVVLNDTDSNSNNYNSERSNSNNTTIHSFSGLSTDLILKSALKKQTHDNVTCVFIAFEGFEDEYKIKIEKCN